MELKIYKPGTRVLISQDGAEVYGLVIAAVIGVGDLVQYKVVWWTDGTRNCEWLDTIEISRAPEDAMRPIGFHRD